MVDYDGGSLVPRYAPRIKPTPIPAASAFDLPTRCVTINERWISHILGLLEVLDQPDAWIGTAEEITAARDEVNAIIAAFHEGNCETTMPTLLRQNPADVCQLQYSNDDGETWSLAFDYGLCIPSWADGLIAQSVANVPPSPYAPEETFIYSEGDDAEQVERRVLALCAAARAVVNTALDSYIAARDGTLVLPSIVSIAGALALTALPIIGVTVWMTIGIAIAVAALDVYLTWATLVDAPIASDAERRDKMACLMIARLTGAAVTPESVYAAFNADACFTGDDENVRLILRDMFNNVASQEDLYNGFLTVLGGATQAAGQGAELEDCGCEEEVWCYKMQGDELRDFFTPTYPTKTTWDETAQAWRAVYLDDGCVLGICGGVVLECSFYVPADTEITGFQFLYDRPDGGAHVGSINIAGETPYGVAASPPYYLPAGGALPISVTGELFDATFGITNNNYSNAIYIHEVTFVGTGRRMFGICDNC